MPGKNLTREEAKARAAIVTVDSYEIALDLTSSTETFRSVTTVRFAGEKGAETFIDLIAPSVEAIILNGEALEQGTHAAASHLTLPTGSAVPR